MYKKNYKKKNYKRYPRKRRGKSRGLSLQRQINQINSRVEIKNKEVFVDQVVDYNGNLFTLCGSMVAGGSDGQRIGKAIWCKNLSVRFHTHQLFSGFYGMMRVVIFRDKAVTVAGPTGSFGYFAPIEMGTGEAPLSFKNENNQYDTVVLYDQTFVFQEGKRNFVVNKTIPVNAFLNFRESDNVCLTNDIRMVVVSDRPVADAARPSINFASKLHYTDS